MHINNNNFTYIPKFFMNFFLSFIRAYSENIIKKRREVSMVKQNKYKLIVLLLFSKLTSIHDAILLKIRL